MSSRRAALGALLAAFAGCDAQDVNEGNFIFAATVRASLGTPRVQADGDSSSPALSADGRYVVFASTARNLVALDTQGFRNVFRRDLQSGVTELVSAGLGGVAADGDSASPSVSGDGSRVVFQSTATNLTADADLGTEDIFLYDFAAGTMTRVTESAGGGEADGPSSNPAISSDGRFVAFQSDATDLIVGDTNGIADVFRRALPAGAVERVSVSESGAEVFNAFAFGSVTPSLSADGSRVAFASDCDDLVTGKTTPWLDIFVRDFGAVAPFLTVRVSIEGAVETDGDSRAPSISADGRWVAFESDATVLAGGEANGFGDIYLADAQTGLVERISVNSAGVGAVNDHCARPSISGDGLLVAFESASFNLVEGDTNGAGDVFLRDRQRGTTTRLSVSTLGAQTGSTETCGRVTLSLDGRFAAFRSNSGVLVSDDTNGLDDIFVRGPLR